MFIKKDDIVIRMMKETDYGLLTTWLNNKDVLEFYGDINNPFDLNSVIEKYEPRVKGLHKVKPCIVEYEDTPIGFMQYYQLDRDQLREFGYEGSKEVFGMDQFIGISNLQSKGIGTKMIKTLIDYIQYELNGTVIILDPHIKNLRAIRCYEKCGFNKKKIIYDHYWLMEYKKE